ncbi:MAG: bifunctional diaminohydroxyphosphoribosylaminopyrimidine deaminase/5-amino-6-(5-phosphoribosylamino)uracil reductase RibD [Acidimicrobiia bacterium]
MTAERLAPLMRRAIAVSTRHRPHPNPRVGALLVSADGEILGEAAHVEAGQPHAERILLDRFPVVPPDAVLVVTLEPCAHTGRTPPCVDLILARGITRVVVGAVDPDGQVAGRGIERLRGAGVDVQVGIEADAVEESDPGYFHHRRTGLPLVTLKQATTLDGQIAAADGTSKWITGPEARRDAHRLRAAHDAVLVGAGTLRADDPGLDVRLDDFDGPQPVPILVAGSRPLPPGLRIWERSPIVLAPEGTVLADVDLVTAGAGGRVDLREGLRQLADRGILSVLAEGGAGVAAALWEAGLITRGVHYLAARLAGGAGRGGFDRVFSTLDEALAIEIVAVTHLGGDLRVDWRRAAGR